MPPKHQFVNRKAVSSSGDVNVPSSESKSSGDGGAFKQRIRIPGIEIIHPSGVGSKSQDLETWRASLINHMSTDKEFSKLVSIISDGIYKSVQTEPKEPDEDFRSEPRKPDRQDFDPSTQDYQTAYDTYDEDIVRFNKMKKVEKRNEELAVPFGVKEVQK